MSKLKKLTSVPVKVLKDCVFRAWNDNSYRMLKNLGDKKVAKPLLMTLAMVHASKELKYSIDPSFFSYHAEELLNVVEKLYASPRTS